MYSLAIRDSRALTLNFLHRHLPDLEPKVVEFGYGQRTTDDGHSVFRVFAGSPIRRFG